MAYLSHCCIFAVDVYKKRYAFASENFADYFGYKPSFLKTIHLQDNGIEERIHPEDRERMMRAQVELGEFIYSLPPGQRNHYRNIFRYRMKNNRGTYIQVTSRHQVLLKDKNEKAWIIMGMLEASPDQHPAENFSYSVMNLKTGEITNPYSPASVPTTLTDRECEILLLMKEGFLSKEIASKLNISIHTVNNHRKNILCKLKADNAIEALNSASRQGIL